MSAPLAPDDVVFTHAAAAANERAPGSTDDPWLHGFGEGVVALAERAERMTSED